MTIPIAIIFAGVTIGAAIFLSTLFQMYVANKVFDDLIQVAQLERDIY